MDVRFRHMVKVLDRPKGGLYSTSTCTYCKAVTRTDRLDFSHIKNAVSGAGVVGWAGGWIGGGSGIADAWVGVKYCWERNFF